MAKYIIIAIIVLLGGLLFVNKDKFLSMDAESNTAAAINSSTGSGGEYSLSGERIGVPGYIRTSNYRGGSDYEWGSKDKPTYFMSWDEPGTVTLVAEGTMIWQGNTGVKSVFKGWSGSGCTGTGPCVIYVDSAKYVKAEFAMPAAPKPQCTPANKKSAKAAIERIEKDKNLTKAQKNRNINVIKDSWKSCKWNL